jgi:hypothetical protein
MRRPLWETLLELVDAVRPAGAGAAGVRVTGLSVDVPLEVTLHRTADGVELLANLPRWRWETDFDQRGGRMRVECREWGES